ncbi:MAG: LPS export ABC transporter periplasmic protein LptC [Thermodesulfovibrionales bacterium]
MRKLIIISILILASILWLVFLEKRDTPQRREVSTFQELNDIIINTESPEGKSWRLEASKAYIDTDDIATLYELRFISEKGNISAPYGRYEINTQKAEINGGVIIKLPDGSEARISSIKLDNDKIKSDEPVVIKKGNIILKGKGIVSDPETGNLKILKNVRLEIR